MLWLCLIFSLVLGIALLWRGVRGARIDDHPLCRRCGFDLTGKPKDSNHCAECGADLTHPNAATLGHRRHSAGLIATGGFLSMLAVLGVALGAWVVMRGVDVNEYKPLWWLLREGGSADASVRAAAITEMSRRLAITAMDQDDVDAIVDRGFQLQADASHPWDTAWGDLLLDTGMKDFQQARYLRNAIIPRLRVRPAVHAGQRLPCEIDMVPARFAANEYAHVKVIFTALTIDGRPIARLPEPHDVYHVDFNENNTSYVFYLDIGEFDAQLPVGKHVVEAVADVRVWEASRLDVLPTFEARKMTCEFEIRPPGAATYEEISDEAIGRQMHGLMRVGRIGYNSTPPAKLEATVHIDPLPADLICEAFVRVDGRELPLDGFHIPAGRPGMAILSSGELRTGSGLRGLLGKRVDLILRTKPDEAINTVTIVRPWKGELIFSDIVR
jgi:hypothetical protein